MNQPPMLPTPYRPNQQYSPMVATSPRTSRPRFGFNNPYPYPRPRSSASKPNPSPAYHSNEEYSFDGNTDGEYYPQDTSLQGGNNSYSDMNSFLSDDNNQSYMTCLDSSFGNRSDFDYAGTEEPPSKKYPEDSFFETSNNGNNGNNNNFAMPRQNSFNFHSLNMQSQYTFPDQAQAQPTKAAHYKRRGTKRKAPSVEIICHCDLCNLDFTSRIPLEMHLRGSKHMKKMKALDTLKLLQSQGHAKVNDTVTKAFRCEACDVTLNGALQLQTHFEGAKHKNKMKDTQSKEADNSALPPETSQVNGGEEKKSAVVVGSEETKAKLGRYACELCNLTVNSQSQLQQHIDSNRHKAKAEGRPIPRRRAKKMAAVADGETDVIIEEVVEDKQPEDAEGATETIHGIPALSSSFVPEETL